MITEVVDDKKTLTYAKKQVIKKENITVIENDEKPFQTALKRNRTEMKERFYKSQLLDSFMQFLKENPINNITMKIK